MKRPFLVLVGEYTSLAFLLPVSTAVGYGVGYLLDRSLGTHFLTWIFLLFGIAGGFIQLIRQVLKDTKDDGD
jgi:F0F1-type ATP synthase assembly protein I